MYSFIYNLNVCVDSKKIIGIGDLLDYKLNDTKDDISYSIGSKIRVLVIDDLLDIVGYQKIIVKVVYSNLILDGYTYIKSR